MRAFLFCLVFGVAGSAQAQQASSPPATTILFVGNSFTYGGATKVHTYDVATVTDEPPGETGVGGIPAIFKKLTDEAGLRYDVHVETVGGKDLDFHLKNARGLLAQGKWDDVVLQGYSTEALPLARGGKPDGFLKSASRLQEAVYQAKPTAKIYLYETWAYPFKKYPENPAEPLAWRRSMSGDMRAGYEQAFSTAGRFEAVAPVGDAFMKLASGDVSPAAKAATAVNLLDTDRKHPSVQGSYLSALVLFQTITGHDATSLGADEQAARDLGVPREEAAALQATADETVRTVRYTSHGVQVTSLGQPSAAHP